MRYLFCLLLLLLVGCTAVTNPRTGELSPVRIQLMTQIAAGIYLQEREVNTQDLLLMRDKLETAKAKLSLVESGMNPFEVMNQLEAGVPPHYQDLILLGTDILAEELGWTNGTVIPPEEIVKYTPLFLGIVRGLMTAIDRRAAEQLTLKETVHGISTLEHRSASFAPPFFHDLHWHFTPCGGQTGTPCS